jgi:hypothetical protein
MENLCEKITIRDGKGLRYILGHKVDHVQLVLKVLKN